MRINSPKDGFALPAYHVSARSPRKGGVVVIQEIFGVTDHIRDIADRYAARGYEAIAPAFFERVAPGMKIDKVDPDAMQAGVAAAQATPRDQVAADLQAAIDALAGPVFVTGFCWGGSMSWLAAATRRGVAGASGFYGRMINTMLDTPPLAPIILHYGEKDQGIPMSAVDEVRAAYAAVPVYTYDAGHGFCREGSHEFSAAARDLSLQRTFDFFDAIAKGRS
jgi:carboxymethylenebutenolidase